MCVSRQSLYKIYIILIKFNENRFEKMISGMYMGELVRCILVDLTNRRLLFGGQGSQKLFTPKSFQTAYISAIESDKKNEYILTRQALAAMDLRHATLDDCDIVKLVSFLQILLSHQIQL